MANLLFCDSWDHYSASQGDRKWTSFAGGIGPGRTGLGFSATGHALSYTLNATYYTMTMGIALKRSFYGEQIGFKNDSPATELVFDSVTDGRLYLRYSGPHLEVTSPLTTININLDTWYYFELQATVTAGPPSQLAATLRVNGVEVLAYNHTGAGGSVGRPFNAIKIINFDGTADDLYVTDTEFLGDVRIAVLYPNAPGDSAVWTPTGAAANWQTVDEHPTADDDTTYVSATAVGNKDLYNLDNIDPAFVGTIKGVQALWLVKKSDEGEGAVKGVWKSGGTEITQSDGHNYIAPGGFYPSATSWLYDIQPKRDSLFTATAWTKAELDALQLGITRTV